MEKLSIQAVKADELKVLATLGRTTFETAFAADNNPADMAQYLNKAFSLNQVRQEWEHPETGYYFARLNNQIVGYLKLNQGAAQSEPMGDDAFEVERIYVTANSQGKGIGRQLLDFSVQQALAAKKKIIWLGVWQKNTRAVAFYKHYGFTIFDTHIYTLGQDDQTDWMMKLEL